MKTTIHPILIALTLVSGVLAKEPPATATPETAGYEKIAPLFDGMGAHHHPVTTQSELAQRYFDQGLVLAYGFNHVDKEKMREPGYGALQHFYTLPAWTYVRFCMWDAALDENKPDDDLKYPRGVWHFARGMALAHTDKPEKAQAELDALAALAADESLDEVTIWDLNTTRDLEQIAEQVLGAAVAEANRDLAAAETKLRKAVELEDALVYDEPPTWFIPPRQLLGALLLKGAKPAEAETTYREELKIYPDNGWSLVGLHQALAAQGKNDAAADAKRRFEKAWTQADVQLASSRDVVAPSP